MSAEAISGGTPMSTDPFDEPGFFEQWLQSGTIRRLEVEIYNDPALEVEADALAKRRAEFEKKPKERSLTDKSEAAALDAAEADLLARFEASLSVWTVRALDDDEWDVGCASHVDPPAPERPAKFEDDAAKTAWWNENVIPWQAECARLETERRLVLIAAAVESVATSRGTAQGVTVEQLRAMRKTTYGMGRINKLFRAVTDARATDVAVPAPKLPNTSGATPA